MLSVDKPACDHIQPSPPPPHPATEKNPSKTVKFCLSPPTKKRPPPSCYSRDSQRDDPPIARIPPPPPYIPWLSCPSLSTQNHTLTGYIAHMHRPTLHLLRYASRLAPTRQGVPPAPLHITTPALLTALPPPLLPIPAHTRTPCDPVLP